MDTTEPATARATPRRSARILIPALIILAWLAGAGIGGPYFGKVGEVTKNEQTAYLPESADATKVALLQGQFAETDAIPAVVIFASSDPLTTADLDAIDDRLVAIAKVSGVAGQVSPAIPSQDGHAVQVFVPIAPGNGLGDTVSAISTAVHADLPDHISAHVTGPGGFIADLTASFSGIDGLLLMVAFIAVFLILIVVYRSLLLPIAVLGTSIFALTVALLTVWWLAKAEIVVLSGQTQGILFILVIGATTDYALLYVARYREQLRIHADPLAATTTAWRGTVEPVLASGGTVIAGLLCLLLSDLKSNTALGPIASIGIVFAMICALTFLPALLFLLGRASFWPNRPIYDPEWTEHPHPGKLWTGVAQLVSTHPRRVWVTTTIVLVFGALAATQFQASGVPSSDLILGASQARDGQEILGKHFPGGSGSPVLVATGQGNLTDAASVLLADPHIASVTVASKDSPSGSAPVTTEGVQGLGPGPAPDPTVVEGRVLMSATLTVAADSTEAETVVRELRVELGDRALVGGTTAVNVDTIDASTRDRNLIIPVILIVITVILMFLLRAILAPLLLVATTVLSFGTAMGVSGLIFNHVLKFPGADPAVPLFGFVFLVALGIDYNIFLMTRVREESIRLGTRPGILSGLTVTGGVITSAGLVLAATFAALSVIPILFLVQIAFIVAFGVLLDTFLVRTLLVPSLSYDIGSRIWWPSALSTQKALHAAPTEPVYPCESEPDHGESCPRRHKRTSST